MEGSSWLLSQNRGQLSRLYWQRPSSESRSLLACPRAVQQHLLCGPRRLLQSERSLQPSVACHASLGQVKAALVGSEDRHAILHDFCMIIPYSCIVAAAGLLSIPFGNGWKGLLLAMFGAVELALTITSLKRWRTGASNMPLTAASAVLAGGLTSHFWSNARRLVAVWPNRLLTLLSAAATLFLVYNILAGGNPPKEDAAVTVEESLTPQKAY